MRGPLAAVGASALTSGALVVAGADDLAPFAVAAVLGAALAGVAVALSAARTAEVRREAVLEERLRIARDLHDVVGHGMGAITVQAGAGRMALDAGADEQVRRALVTIEQAGRGVLREVRWLVGVLRERPERATLADLGALAEAARGAGLAVEVTIDGDIEAVPAATAEAAYRIVQESLTNVLRHSGADHAQVRIGTDDAVTPERARRRRRRGRRRGHGIRGMRERAAAVGGDLRGRAAHRRPGWEITARLPIGWGRR